MIRSGIAALAAIACISAASAADVPVRRAPMQHYVAPAYNWTGFYIGVNGGYAWGKATDTFVDWNHNGGMFGGTAGYNWQFGSIVLGIEGDVDWTNMSGSTLGGLVTTKSSWVGSARGRVGYAFDRFLPFVTGGAAFGDGKICIVQIFCDQKTHVGWTVGGGLEYALPMHNWTAKVEFRHSEFGTKDYTILGITGPGGFKSNTALAGINYRF